MRPSIDRDAEGLQQHYTSEHHSCTDPDCADGLVAFGTEEELRCVWGRRFRIRRKGLGMQCKVRWMEVWCSQLWCSINLLSAAVVVCVQQPQQRACVFDRSQPL